MLRPDDAEKRLEAFRIKDWAKKRVAALGALPDKPRTAGRALLDRDPAGKPFKNWQKAREAREQAVEWLHRASAKDRVRVFSTLFPKLGPLMEQAWQLISRLPYESGYQRKGFRAPNEPTVHKDRRDGWLRSILGTLEGYDEDVVWAAAWAPHLSRGYHADEIGLLCAAAIEAGGPVGEQVFEVLRESGSNQHEVGQMGRHVTRGLLVASRPDGWEYVEKLLIAAQRQEGLRQVILETIDEAHPEAFRRKLRLILEHNLLRFGATVRAIDVWLGLRWEAPSAGVVKRTVESLLRFLEDRDARAEALARENGEQLYLALWTMGFEDAVSAVPHASALLKDNSVERRYVAVKFLEDLELPAARQALVAATADSDLRIAVSALEACIGGSHDENDLPDMWDTIVSLRARLPERRQEGEALVWEWATVTLDRKSVTGHLIPRLGKRPATALLPYLPDLSSYGRVQLIEQIGKLKKWDATMRDTLFTLAGDRDGWVRGRALEALKKCDVTEADAQRIEGLLVRKGSELRQGIIRLLKKLKSPMALASADRLLESKKLPQRLGGLELLREMVDKKRAVPECRKRAEEYRTKYPDLSDDEQLLIEGVLDIQREKPSLNNSLGLMNPDGRSKAIEPKARKVTLLTPAAVGVIQSLTDLIAANNKAPVRFEGDEDEELLGNVSPWRWPDPDWDSPADEDAARLPLRELWEKWYAERPNKLRDRDGLELIRAWVWVEIDAPNWRGWVKRYGKTWGDWLALMSAGESPMPKLKHRELARSLLDWLIRLHPPEKVADFLLDVQETAFALVPADVRNRVVNIEDWRKRDQDWRCSSPLEAWLEAKNHFSELFAQQANDAHRLREWQLAHWRDQSAPGVARMRPGLNELLAGFKAGQVTADDVYDHLIGPGGSNLYDLGNLTAPDSQYLKDHPGLAPYLDAIRARVLEVELKRGEIPTAASQPAKSIQSLWGVSTLMRILGVVGKKPFARSTYGEGRVEVLTHLVQVTYPSEGDTPEAFAEAVKAAGLSRERLLELGFVAPQWLEHVEHAVGWSGLREGVWWYLAHMPGARSGVGGATDGDADYDVDFDEVEDRGEARERRVDPWERIIRDRTTLTEEERGDGAIDAAWFHRVYEPLGAKRWEALGAAAKFGCTGNGHKKALLLSEVLLGKARRNELISNIRDRKLKEPVRLLGLMPLPEGDKREPELAARYKVLAEYRRYTRTLSPMSKEDAERTARIGLENLARTAGYPDPMRLEWAMEARELADLAAGPVSATAEGVTVTLAITPQAQPEMTVRRGDKPLKNVPPNVRKAPKVAQLLERRTELKRSASRVKYSMEAAMVRGDTFTGRELRQLFAHPLLRPILERLVLLGEGIRGYPVAEGQALEDHAGKKEPIKPDEKLRVAHPHDLYAAGDWDRWQHDLFARERVQPFKQVFRELYLVTQQERDDQFVSRRYAGQQVNPSQAMALWGSRSWSVRDGEVSKTFYDDRLIAEVGFQHHGWTAAQVEGRTVDTVSFRRRGTYERVALADVPPRVFSEVMRDCDLVVSVAHAGGVDPEASASTVEMRAALLRELCSLLGISNYKIERNHVHIDGHLGQYSVHLGSAVVHRLPGGHVCIVPVHAQHRGRLFLPFADDDPRSAEVLSKVMLLARDNEIQDPSILEQLR